MTCPRTPWPAFNTLRQERCLCLNGLSVPQDQTPVFTIGYRTGLPDAGTQGKLPYHPKKKGEDTGSSRSCCYAIGPKQQ